jgi:hypothetical protein
LLDAPQESLQAWLQLAISLAQCFTHKLVHNAGAAASLIFCRCIKQGAGSRPKPDQKGCGFGSHAADCIAHWYHFAPEASLNISIGQELSIKNYFMQMLKAIYKLRYTAVMFNEQMTLKELQT